MGRVGKFFSRLATCFFHLWVFELPVQNFQSQTKDLYSKKHLLVFSPWLSLVVQEFYFGNCSPPNQNFKL